MTEQQYQIGRSIMVSTMFGSLAAMTGSVTAEAIGIVGEFNQSVTNNAFVIGALYSMISDTTRASSTPSSL